MFLSAHDKEQTAKIQQLKSRQLRCAINNSSDETTKNSPT